MATDLLKYYSVRSGSSENSRFAWAAGYGPLNLMPFLDEMPLILERKERFWEVNPRPPGLIVDPGASVWPDFLGCGGGPPYFFISDTVIDDMAANGIPVWRKTEMPIATIRSKRLREKKPPRYFVVEVEPGISIDYEASGVEVGSDGKPIYTRDQRLNLPPHRIDPATWTGADLFSCFNFMNRQYLICTEKVKRLAEKEGWLNVHFEKHPMVRDDPKRFLL